MKRKSIYFLVLLSFVLISLVSFNISRADEGGQWHCISDPEWNNTGYCRKAGQGGNLCYPSGPGSYCNYAKLFPTQE